MKVVATELGAACSLKWASRGRLWERCFWFPGLVLSPLTLSVPPAATHETSIISSTGFADRAIPVQRSAVSRDSEGMVWDLATVAYTVQNNFLFL